jgi:hypothetical protein
MRSESAVMSRVWRWGAMLVAAAMMLWPAIYNGLPLVYADSMTYLDDGRIVARAVFLHQLAGYYGMRSFFYSLGILPFHWNVTLWPVAALQAVLTAYVLWLVVRSILLRRIVVPYLILVLLLSAFTSLGWYVDLILPDILGPLLYLSIYLLVFARDSVSRGERISLYLIAFWGITSHATHLILAAIICFLLGLVLVVSRVLRRRYWIGAVEVATVLLVAAAAQLALHGYLYGHPSLNGERPPFLTARVIADGPGRWYLEKNCGQLKWVICDHVHHLPDNPDDFLWTADGVWQNLTDDENKRMLQEELPFVLATLRTYPREQLSRSAANFWAQLLTFDLEDLDSSDYVLSQFNPVIPSERSHYAASRQARNAIDLDFFSKVINWSVIASLLVIGVFTPLLWRRFSARLIAFGVLISVAVVANAMFTGTLSLVEDRLESRVIWLVPLLAGLMILFWREKSLGQRIGEENVESVPVLTG